MKHEDIPPRWKQKVFQWLSVYGNSYGGSSRESFVADDFPSLYSISVIFDDGSTASFKHAILIEAPELDEIGVFTEHCGYHIFPLKGTHVARIEA